MLPSKELVQLLQREELVEQKGPKAKWALAMQVRCKENKGLFKAGVLRQSWAPEVSLQRQKGGHSQKVEARRLRSKQARRPAQDLRQPQQRLEDEEGVVVEKATTLKDSEEPKGEKGRQRQGESRKERSGSVRALQGLRLRRHCQMATAPGRHKKRATFCLQRS